MGRGVMLQSKPFRTEHVSQLGLTPAYFTEVMAELSPLVSRLAAGITVVDGSGKVLGMGGLFHQRPRVAHAWLVKRPDATGHSVARIIRRFWDTQCASNQWRRIQTTHVPTHMEAAQLLTWLGFEYEGTMRALAGPGQHRELWAWVHPSAGGGGA